MVIGVPQTSLMNYFQELDAASDGLLRSKAGRKVLALRFFEERRSSVVATEDNVVGLRRRRRRVERSKRRCRSESTCQVGSVTVSMN